MIQRQGMVLAGALFLISSGVLCADDWPQWLGPKRDSIWRETGILEKFPEGGPKVLWREPVAGGICRAGGGRGPSLCRRFCDRRRYAQSQHSRMSRSEIKGEERVLCLDAKIGRTDLDARLSVQIRDFVSGRSALHSDRAPGQSLLARRRREPVLPRCSQRRRAVVEGLQARLPGQDARLGLLRTSARRWPEADLRGRRRRRGRLRLRQGHRQRSSGMRCRPASRAIRRRRSSKPGGRGSFSSGTPTRSTASIRKRAKCTGRSRSNRVSACRSWPRGNRATCCSPAESAARACC